MAKSALFYAMKCGLWAPKILAPLQTTANFYKAICKIFTKMQVNLGIQSKLLRITEPKILPSGENYLTELFILGLIYSILEEVALLKGDYS